MNAIKKLFSFFSFFLWRLPKGIFCKINECEENFLHKFAPEYKSKLALHSIIYFFASTLTLFLGTFLCSGVVGPMCVKFGWELSDGLMTILFLLPVIIFFAIYLVLYLKKRLPMIEGRKWWYCVQVALALMCGTQAIFLPVIVFVWLLVIAFYVVAAIAVIWTVLLFFGVAFDRPKGKKWKLLDGYGTVIKEEKGLCGEKYYTDELGREYERLPGDDFVRK